MPKNLRRCKRGYARSGTCVCQQKVENRFSPLNFTKMDFRTPLDSLSCTNFYSYLLFSRSKRNGRKKVKKISELQNYIKTFLFKTIILIFDSCASDKRLTN